jgi:hypothetical protein
MPGTLLYPKRTKTSRMKLSNAEGRELLKLQGKKKPVTKWQQPKPKPATANQITTAAIDWLNLNGFKAYRNNNGAVFDPVKQCFRKNKNLLKGVPDICGYQKGTGKALFIEVKAGKDKLSPEQINFLSEAEKGGAICGVIRESKEIETIIQKYKLAA